MGYRDNAFFRLPESERNAPEPVNPAFAYPPKSIRFLEEQARLNNSKDGYKLQRGYIRGLKLPGVANSASFANKKCAFQFNPQRIIQSVQLKQDMYLPILQDPGQFIQPVGSMTNFSFDLLFDRSEEVNRGNTSVTTPFGAYEREANLTNANPTTDVNDIGVFADLQVLYSIIGQGFSEDLIEFQKERFISGARDEFLRREGDAETAGTAFDEFAAGETASENLRKFTDNINSGNAAFLIPFPVRIIFSSLFMIDGFVTATTVDFLKFNTNMVPVQAKVGLSVQAVYIGFAKEKTLITEEFDRQQIEIENEAAEASSTSIELKNALKDVGKTFRVGLSSQDNWRTSTGSSLFNYIIDESSPGSNPAAFGRGFKLGFSAIQESTEENAETKEVVEDGVKRQVPTVYNDKVLKLIRAGGVEARYNWQVLIWGPYDTQQTATTVLSMNSMSESDLMGSYSGLEVATTDEEWGYGENNKNGIRQREHGAGGDTRWTESPNTNTAPEKLVYTAVTFDKDFYESKYYIIRASVSCSFKTTNTMSDPIEFRAEGRQSAVKRGNGSFFVDIYLDWGP